MHKTPPREDEQPEYSATSHKLKRRNNTIMSKRQGKSYHSDEHPEIPRIRRASLNFDEPPMTRTPTNKVGQSRKSPDDEQEQDATSTSYGTNKIMVAQRRRPTVYEPPPNTPYRSATRRKRQQRSLLMRMQNISHNRTFMLTGTLLIFILITLPIAIGAIRNQINHPLSTISTSGSTTGNANTTSKGVQASDPHEIVITPSDTDHPAPPVLATSAYLLDADTGATLYAHNPFTHLPMLSTTKLMTALLAAEQGNPDQTITINDAIANDLNQLSADSSLMGIKKGETYTLRDLLYGLMLVSGNDAAIAIADTIGGNLPNFVAKMNQRANQLGLYDTHYMNPHGLLTTGHFSSAHDLAVLGKYSLGNPLIHQISGTETYHITQSANHADHYLINGNQFLWWYPGVDAGKPGWDGATDFVQVISVTRNHHHLIGVTMNTSDWWTDMRNLMNWGFDTFDWISPYDVDLQHPIPYDNQWNYFTRDKKENTIPTADNGRYYIYTGYSVSGLILAYFDKNGGLTKFGYPTAEPQAASNPTFSQQFQHGTIQCDPGTKVCQTV
ncbi:MAG: D-alanyl-D-alanine carboxypeptidase [Chloroflexi bacterium]|nr:D-alanyl-D-alanine carboxypeptidase [Chloroflexota bacterium]